MLGSTTRVSLLFTVDISTNESPIRIHLNNFNFSSTKRRPIRPVRHMFTRVSFDVRFQILNVESTIRTGIRGLTRCEFRLGFRDQI